jgi:hypothetical protein
VVPSVTNPLTEVITSVDVPGASVAAEGLLLAQVPPPGVAVSVKLEMPSEHIGPGFPVSVGLDIVKAFDAVGLDAVHPFVLV